MAVFHWGWETAANSKANAVWKLALCETCAMPKGSIADPQAIAVGSRAIRTSQDGARENAAGRHQRT